MAENTVIDFLCVWGKFNKNLCVFGESVVLGQPVYMLSMSSDISHSWCEGGICYLFMPPSL